MKKTLAAEVARLEKMSVSKLAERFEEVFGEQCRSRHKRYLIRRIAWRLQANAEGGLSERARQRAGGTGQRLRNPCDTPTGETCRAWT